MNELDEIIAWVREHGPVPLPLKGWDHASIWGWDETTSSLYAHMRPNTDDPAKSPELRIAPGDYTPAITLLPTLAQHIAMATDSDPWKVLTALFKVEEQDEYQDSKTKNTRPDKGGTVVTMTDGYDV